MKRSLLIFFFIISFTNPLFSKPGGDPPVANYSYYIEFVGVSAEVSFLNLTTDGDTYFWDFGDGFTSADTNAFHLFALPGIYVVCLTATNEFGSSTFCDTLVTYYAPSSAFIYSGDPLVTFTDLSSNFPTEWYWDFGDDDTSTLQNPTHLYLANGDYTVCQSCSNPGGTNYSCQVVTISSYALTEPAFSYTGDPDVFFTDLSTLSPTSWFWDFGDGATSTEQNPEHVFTSAGVYTVCLTATNAGGSATHCEDVVIGTTLLAPVADFSYDVIIDCGAVQYTDISANLPALWNWTFPDGTTSTEQNPVYTLSSTYIDDAEVCLSVTNAVGSDSVCKIIEWCSLGFETHDNNDLTIFPNPANDIIFLTVTDKFRNSAIEIYNMLGEKVTDQGVGISTDHMQYNVSGLPNGNYFIQAVNDSEQAMIQFSIVR